MKRLFLLVALLLGLSCWALNINSNSRTCKNCKKSYIKGDNSVCTFHPGLYTGRLNRVNDVDTSGLEFFWSCCGNYDLNSAGCVNDPRHVSYDEDGDDKKYSVLTGKPMKYT